MPDLLRRGWSLLRAPANELGFVVRSTLRWRRGAPPRRGGDGPTLFAWLPAARRDGAHERAAALTQRYDLGALREAVDAPVFARNLARLEGLERLIGGRAAPLGPDGALRAVDVGCGDFHYATALQRGLSRAAGGARVVLRGVELDGHGVYRDGHSRADHAAAHAAGAGRGGDLVTFETGDVAAMRLPEQDVVTAFFPFLTAYACLQWGTPLSRLRPRRLLRRAVQALRPGGWLLVVNQTVDEHRRLCRLLRELPVERLRRCRFGSDLVPEAGRTAGQVASLWRRHAMVPIGKPTG
ncbi:MAG: hypothetical protein H6835_03930 [Planctomycetes bacterium]|nr:hypothetical protein [Planctomycetota bacterium]